MTDNGTCNVCGCGDLATGPYRDVLPAMQNYVYRTARDAASAPRGPLELRICRRCGYARNVRFDPSLLRYDEGYDNLVPSAVMGEYYRDLARHLKQQYLPEGGWVVDVGCGKGAFLRAMVETFDDVRGLGIDPSYEGPAEQLNGRLTFVAEPFGAAHVPRRPDLIVLRHVLEHMPDPVGFLGSIFQAVGGHDRVPIFIEVPDSDWILAGDAFWDFCYEHVNYFTAGSLRAALARTGAQTRSTRTGYGGQYLWLEGLCLAGQANGDSAAPEVAKRFEAYCARESAAIEAARERLAALKRDGWTVVVWGMATKGVMFTLLADPDGRWIDRCVDVNPNKQGCFVPISARRIDPPEALASEDSGKLAVIVMNLKYLDEIARSCAELSLGGEVRFLDAHCAELSRRTQ